MCIRVLVLIAAGLVLGGCVLRADNPHNDVMLFATSTTLGVDVGAPVQNAGIPEFTVGYKRNEGVWMPLKPNSLAEVVETRGPIASIIDAFRGRTSPTDANVLLALAGGSVREQEDTQALFEECRAEAVSTFGLDVAKLTDAENSQIASYCLVRSVPTQKYVSAASGIDSKTGGTNLELDTYSVFASFGGRGSIGFNQASGALAQFFATGIAAQRLGANPQVGVALNANAPEAIEARAKADEAEANLAGLRAERAATTERAVKCIQGWTADGASVPETLTNERAKTIITEYEADTSAQRNERLVANLEIEKPAMDAIIQACQSGE